MRLKRTALLVLLLVFVAVLALSHSAVQRTSNGIIAFITDWGSRDWYVGAVKGVALSIFPEATIVDITHDVPPFELEEGAATLWFSSREFPSGTVFVAVVDPGVGTERRPLVVHTENDMFFVGPDNGLFTYVVLDFGVKAVYQITNESFMRPPVSYTFHGRDIFTPTAANLAAGRKVSEVGPEITDYIMFDVGAAYIEDELIYGEVMNHDQYGNLRTNITREYVDELGLTFGDRIKLTVEGKTIETVFVNTYGDVEVGEFLTYVASTDQFAIAINWGNAREYFDADIGSEVIIEKIK